LRNPQSSFDLLPSNSLLMVDLYDKHASGRNTYEVLHKDSSGDNFDGHDEFLPSVATTFGVFMFENL
jgi:hypothetical protein